MNKWVLFHYSFHILKFHCNHKYIVLLYYSISYSFFCINYISWILIIYLYILITVSRHLRTILVI